MTALIQKLVLASITLLLLNTNAYSETSVIVHPSNASSFEEKTISQIFLGKKKSFSSGESALPINQKEGTPTREGFDKTLLNKSSSQVKAYWAKLMFTGKGQPPKEVAASEMKSLVASNPSTIGYIDSEQVDDSVKVVFTY
jgi:ABC-type phosphate transport system substrate-binding protein